MFLNKTALQELNKILEKDYGIQLETSTELQLLKNFGESLLNLLASAIKARSRASRLGINIPPSCLEERHTQYKQQQLFSVEKDDTD